MEAEEEDLLCLDDMSGELETRFRERGCNGDWGMEIDRRSVFLADDLTKSFEDACLRTGAGAGALIASLRDLRVAFMTSVARIDLSFGDNCSPSSWISVSTTVFFVLVFAAGVLAVFVFGAVAAFVGFFAIVPVVFWPSDFGSKSSLSIVTVAGVHVDAERTAVRIESAVICEEAMMIRITSKKVFSIIDN